MKRFILFVTALCSTSLLLFAEGRIYHSEWLFKKESTQNRYGADFLQTGRYNSAKGDDAWLRFESNNKEALPRLTQKSEPICYNTREGDTWVFEMPVESLEKGSVVDVWIPFHSQPTGVGHRFIAEYKDGNKWLPLMPTDSTGANFRTFKTKKTGHVWGAFRLKNNIKKGVLGVRIRQVEESIGASYVSRYSSSGMHPQIICYPNPEIRDTTRVLFIGNSYTYYNTYPFIFKDMAMREGHYADCRMSVVGGYTMKKHLAYEPSVDAIEAGSYDYAFLQDQSYERLFTGTEDDKGNFQGMTEIVGFVRQYSPEVQAIISLTWGRRDGGNRLKKQDLPLVEKYPTFFTDFDAMQTRLNEVVALEAKSLNTKIASQGPAWQIVRHERPDINLFVADGSHPSYEGSYLAAAVAYLTVFGEPFGSNPSNGNLDPATAAYLRSVAERVVLKGEEFARVQ